MTVTSQMWIFGTVAFSPSSWAAGSLNQYEEEIYTRDGPILHFSIRSDPIFHFYRSDSDFSIRFYVTN